MKTYKRTLSIGSISEGTTIAADILDSLIYDLERVKMSRADRNKVRAGARELAKYRAAQTDPSEADADVESLDDGLSELLDELTNVATNYVPAFCYVGNHPGDGADFGVWVDMESVERAVQDREVYKGDCLPSASYQSLTYTPPHMAVVVNDHGNATLYRRAGNRWREVWAVV